MSNNQEERELENFNNDIETSLVDAIFGSQNQNKNKNNSPILNNTEVQIELNTDSFVEIPINKTNNNNNQLPIFSPDSVNNFSPTFESTKDTFSNTPNSQSRNNSETSSNSEVDEESEIASNSNFQTSPRSSTEIIRNENKTNINNNKIEKENKKGKKEKKETKEKDKKDKKEKKKKNRSTISTFISLFPYIWPSKKTSDFATEVRIRVVISFALLFLAKIVSVTLPQFFKYAVDSLTNITPESNFHVPIIYIIIYGVLKMLSTSIVDLRDLVFFKVGQEVTRSICIKTFVHLENLSYRFHTQRKTGTVLRAMDRGTESIANILNVLMFNVLPTILEVVLTCIILISEYKFYFTLVTFGTISFYVIFTLVVTEYRNKYRRLANQKDNEATDKAVESMLNFETVKYFATEVHEKQRYDEALKQFNITGMKAQFSLAVLNFGQSFIIGLGLIAVMAMAAAGVNKGSMTVGDFVLFNAYIIQLYSPLTWLGDAYRTVTKSIVDMENLFDLLDEDIEVKDSPNAKELKVPSGEVEFKNVSFSYDDENQILKDISFKIPAGKTVAIVGSSGSGKTTTSRLLFRFYDIQKGSITIDGQDIRNVTQKSLRENIGIVPQQTELFNETLQYNISYGKIGATEDEVDAAAFRSKIQKLVKKLPEKYNTIVGERGARLSGGEKQRVSIARAMLKNPKIMILDEATSSLDSKTEKEIHHSLKEVCLNRTTLIIAHRLSTIVEADEILVMKHGTIIERGNFEQLTSNPNGVFTEMWQRSQKDKE